MTLDLSSLNEAIHSLERTLKVANSVEKMQKLDEDQQYAIRAGVIQNFEFTYELCWKFMQRWIRNNLSPEDAEHTRTRKDLFRTAAKVKLIKDPLPWFDYSIARNITAHTYSADKAEDVFNITQNFFHDAKYLLEKLTELND